MSHILPSKTSYWRGMPMSLPDDKGENGCVGSLVDQKDPTCIPTGFKWICHTKGANDILQRVHSFLNKHYVRNAESSIHYTLPMLQWYFRGPGGSLILMLVSAKQPDRIWACVSAILYPLQCDGQQLSHSVAINFLCVHPKLRDRRLVPVVIRELCRQARLKWPQAEQAIYTSGTNFGAGWVTTACYMERYLDLVKLKQCNYLGPHVSVKNLTVPTNSRSDVWKRVTCHTELQQIQSWLPTCRLSPAWNPAMFSHWIQPKKHIVDTFIFVDKQAAVSGYWLDLKVHDSNLKVFYWFFATPGCIHLNAHERDELLGKILALGADTILCLNINGLARILESFRFRSSSTRLHYYMYNWRMSSVASSDLSVVLI